MKWLALLISLSLLVVTHELGHLGFAKLFKTRVRRFYVFFNPYFSIFKAKKFEGKWHFLFFNKNTPDSWDEKNLGPKDQNNTLWGLGWLPLGGYCDIAGMIDETKGADDLESTPQPWEYRSKPTWQRLCIISGGVLVNFVSALLLYGIIFAHWGKDELPLRNAKLGYEYHQVMLDEGFKNGDIIYAIDGKEMYEFSEASTALLLDNPKVVTVMRGDSLVDLTLSGHLLEKVNEQGVQQLMAWQMPFVIDKVMTGMPAQKGGLQPGDSLVGVDGMHSGVYTDITAYFHSHEGEEVGIAYCRNGRIDTARVTLTSEGTIGVQAVSDFARFFEVKHIDYTFLQAIPAGISHGWQTLVTYVTSLKVLFQPSGVKSLGGFGTLGSLFPETWDWHSFWSITAFLALILAFMNIIPIPGLDGGHLMFVLWEMISGRTPSEKFLTVVQNIGLFLLLALMIIANGNDLLRGLGISF